MRVAVFTDEGGLQDRVSYHFGRARTVTVVDLDDMESVEVIQNPHGAGRGGGRALSEALARRGIDAVIVGGIGPGALSHLLEYGIRVYRAAGMSVSDALKSLAEGKLEEIREPCEDGECGHGCESESIGLHGKV
ncbi:NifB/NifX family molybdenum-iron cluster-binding protein [Candidatus Korarchaeum cryptofilum]|uniref:NifB/NifX family molybdenum-iron cluster-binding protein n=1 Tax=Candidatus Korarchaeum cryptofilum TaxID=498846 RepID=UPI00163BD0E4|nr:NifB/NifX family molybdenum-iron cluster-binding protein [Candidatus Korarchaeum cryptofilum]